MIKYETYLVQVSGNSYFIFSYHLKTVIIATTVVRSKVHHISGTNKKVMWLPAMLCLRTEQCAV